MKIKLSQYTPRKAKWTIIISKVSTLSRKITLEYLTKIFLVPDALHAMRKDTSLEIVPETKVALKRTHHAHAAEDDEPFKKRTRYESEDSSIKEEYVLISTLIGNITHGSNDWLIDSRASKHMIGFKESFVKLL